MGLVRLLSFLPLIHFHFHREGEDRAAPGAIIFAQDKPILPRDPKTYRLVGFVLLFLRDAAALLYRER